MTSHPIDEIEYLSSSERGVLTQLLALQGPNRVPHRVWLSDQMTFVAGLPANLRRSSSWRARVAQHLQHLPLNVLPSRELSRSIPRTLNIPFTSPRALLCWAHWELNPVLIRRIFVQISAEVTLRQERLLRYFLEGAVELPPEVAYFMRDLQRINSFWMDPDLFRTKYQFMPEDWRYDRFVGGVAATAPRNQPRDEKEEGCEACLLARIGGDEKILTDLWISAHSRKRAHHDPPRILGLVEEWLLWLGIRISDENNEHAMSLRRQLRDVRRQVQVIRNQRAGRHGRHANSVPVAQHDQFHGHSDDRDAPADELSIIDFYRNSVTMSALAHIRTPGERENTSNAVGASRDPLIRQDPPIVPVPPRANSFELDSTPLPESPEQARREEWEDWNDDADSISPEDSASQVGSRPFDRPQSHPQSQGSAFNRTNTAPARSTRYSESIYPPPSMGGLLDDSGISGLPQSGAQRPSEDYKPYQRPHYSSHYSSLPPVPPLPRMSETERLPRTNNPSTSTRRRDALTTETQHTSYLAFDDPPADPRRCAEARAESYRNLIGHDIPRMDGRQDGRTDTARNPADRWASRYPERP